MPAGSTCRRSYKMSKDVRSAAQLEARDIPPVLRGAGQSGLHKKSDEAALTIAECRANSYEGWVSKAVTEFMPQEE